jgi:hypothetical protein
MSGLWELREYMFIAFPAGGGLPQPAVKAVRAVGSQASAWNRMNSGNPDILLY